MANSFTEDGFMGTLRKYGKVIGYETVYNALLLFYTVTLRRAPAWVQAAAIAALSYLILPIDAIPDFIPGGFIDDAAVMAAALAKIAAYITDDVRFAAKGAVPQWLK